MAERIWCEVCGYVTQEYIEDQCQNSDCYMENRPVDVGDELHSVLAEALNSSCPQEKKP